MVDDEKYSPQKVVVNGRFNKIRARSRLIAKVLTNTDCAFCQKMRLLGFMAVLLLFSFFMSSNNFIG